MLGAWHLRPDVTANYIFDLFITATGESMSYFFLVIFKMVLSLGKLTRLIQSSHESYLSNDKFVDKYTFISSYYRKH